MAKIFIEQFVKQKTPIFKLMYAYFLLALTIVFALAGFFLFPMFLCIALLLGLLFWWVNMQNKVEFEYSCMSDELNIDRIIAQQKRKGIIRMVIGKMEVLAPSYSPKIKEHKYAHAKVLNCSSREKDAKTYTLIYNGDDGRFEVIFEPEEEILQALKDLAPHKIFID